jgi:hypothetical protein
MGWRVLEALSPLVSPCLLDDPITLAGRLPDSTSNMHQITVSHRVPPLKPCFMAFLAQYGVQKRTNNLYPTPVILEATRTRGRSILKAALSPLERMK